MLGIDTKAMVQPATVGAAQRVPVLMYHRIDQAENAWARKFAVAPELFAAQMQSLRGRGYHACKASDVVAWMEEERTLPGGSFLLTFDDGYLSVYEHAFPVLAELGWPATVFLVSDLVGGRDSWTAAENPSGSTHPLLCRSHLVEMAAQGFAFHSHSSSHLDLTALPTDRLHAELTESKRRIEDMVGYEADLLAYPFGRHDNRVVSAAAKAGYRAAFSVQPGFNRPGVDPYRVRRLDVFGTDTPVQLLRKMAFGSNDGSVGSAARYFTGRLVARGRSLC